MRAELWTIELFGGLRARCGERVLTRFRTSKLGSLLAYLALHKEHLHPREELMELFWPEMEASAARHNFRQNLYLLRRLLESPDTPSAAILLVDQSRVQLTAVHTDVADFEAAMMAAARREAEEASPLTELLRAADLYRGELLRGYYDEWIFPERQRLADLHLRVLHQLAARLEQAGDLPRAIAYARRAVAADAFQEEAHLTLMRLLAAAGRPAEALQQYEVLKRLLDEELGLSPSDAACELAQRLSANHPKAPLRPPAFSAMRPVSPRVTSAYAPPEPPVPRLPAPLTRFFGRREELDLLCAILRPTPPCSELPHARLVTLIGPGGVGKTRLGLEAARRMTDDFAGAVWFVPLAEQEDASQLPDALLSALGIRRHPERTSLEQVADHLGARPALLALDNFEQIADEGAAIIRELLVQAQQLRCLITSRRRLDIEGEQVVSVPPLPVRDDSGNPSLAALASLPGVALFVDRAQMARLDFQLTERNAAAIASLCSLLEGLPLALELAAARIGLQTVEQMLDQMKDRFGFLVSRRKDLSSRHRSLRAALAWSYSLLTPELQRLFARLSVFRGGWTLEAADVVCEEEPTRSAPSLLSALEQLRDSSLILTVEQKGEMRYGMLETLREFAEERLTEEESAAMARRHALYFARCAEENAPRTHSEKQFLVIRWMEQEQHNVSDALEWCKAQNDQGEAMLWLTGMLAWFWKRQDRLADVRSELEEVIGRPEAQAATRARAFALDTFGGLAARLRDQNLARALFQEELEIGRVLQDRRIMAEGLGALGYLAYEYGEYAAARAGLTESLTIRQEIGDRYQIAQNQHTLGIVLYEQGERDAAAALYEQSLAIRRELGDIDGVMLTLSDLGNVAKDRGDMETAWAYHHECLAIRRGRGERYGMMASLVWLANVAYLRGDYAEARALGEEGLALAREIGDRLFLGAGLLTLGNAVFHLEGAASARALHRESLIVRRDISDRNGVAATLEAMAWLEAAVGKAQRAARLFGAAEAQRQAIGMAMTPPEQAAHEHHLEVARAALDDKTFSSEWSEGYAMPSEEAVAYALRE